MNIINFLSGKKTYIIALILLGQTAYSFFSGQIDLQHAITGWLEGAGLATLRMGVTKSSPA